MGGFVVASFFNAILLSKTDMFNNLDAKLARKCYRLACLSLLCSQLGAVLFVTGSFMYRPGYNNHCDRHNALQQKWRTFGSHIAPNHTGTISLDEALKLLTSKTGVNPDIIRDLIPEHEWCVDVMDDGTGLYIIGSVLYLVQSLLYLRIVWMKQVAADSKRKKDGEESSAALSGGSSSSESTEGNSKLLD